MKEIKRLKVMSMLEEKLMTRAGAVKKLNMSKRLFYRIQKSYCEKGEQGLVHGNRVKPSQKRVCKEDSPRTQIAQLLVVHKLYLNVDEDAVISGPEIRFWYRVTIEEVQVQGRVGSP